MIKANELRIGNYILLNGKLKYVNWRTIRDLRCQSNDEEDVYEPIPITEEILLKNGYKKQNGYGYSNYNIYGTVLKNDNGFEFHYYGIIIRLDFIHQLQNLFFTFYREKLKVSL